mmetsp:Transcript_28524/g.50651  ORF Transcript_28524/g.50651 Transcript_28524/m.50651 type:complete len:246 (-) Transcript_28524:24-761(-)|eukprot:CAMPEP_0204896306 /NCGR_PEP_ID=MMETSP1397-20131031/88_1 /ASSEMBLY_ACC=CAM_ASM_000891 /TAXON_ID=49980 /ORGANISM="Climacostomum Climacostomum virens, Strain Stock W-24" /LENGTH=245 /DNA_ID=CAMNT_0052063899 /DNA_START=97 /DNA_END=834 /DNA_ORIENTATION=+
MENEIAEEQKAMRPTAKSPLNPGFGSRSKEHVVKSPFTRFANHKEHKEQPHIKAARLHIGMLRSPQDEISELERTKKELDHMRMREIEHVQQIEVLKSMLRRQEGHIRALKTENSRLKHQSRLQPSYDDTELLLALQLSAAECGVESQIQIGVDPDTMSYEQLLELGEQIGSVSVGLTPKQFADLKEEVSEMQISTCSICQTDIERGQLFKRLPSCTHLHHSECIWQWFQKKNECPVCKASAIAK